MRMIMREYYNERKKIFFVLLIAIILLCFNSRYVSAGDAFFSVCTNREPQDALLIGKVINIEDTSILNIEILRVICGKIDESQIKYSNRAAAKNISAGDYVLLSVEKEDGIYKKCYSVCHEVTIENGDKISSIKPLEQEENEDWEISLQWFCNTGTIIGDATDSGKYYDEEQTLVYDMNEHKWYKDPLLGEYPSPNTQTAKASDYILPVILLSVALLFVFFIGLRLYRQGKKNA